MSFLLSRPGKSACHFMSDCSSKSGSSLQAVRVAVSGLRQGWGLPSCKPQHDTSTPLTPRWRGGGKLDLCTSNYRRPTGSGNDESVRPRTKRNERYTAVSQCQLMPLCSKERKAAARSVEQRGLSKKTGKGGKKGSQSAGLELRGGIRVIRSAEFQRCSRSYCTRQFQEIEQNPIKSKRRQ